jgi:hypothetical protein
MRISTASTLISGILALASPAGAIQPSSPTAATSDANAVSQVGIVALRKVVITLNGGSDVSSSVDMFAVLQMRVIGGNDPTWRGGQSKLGAGVGSRES